MQRAVTLACLALLAAATAHADVRTDEKTRIKFEGVLGRMLNLCGGQTTRDGAVSTVAVKGDRKITLNGDTARIVDLKEEQVYDLDMKGKTYRVTTFAELRRQMEDARKKAAEQVTRSQAEPQKPSGDPRKDVDVDVSLKENGQLCTISGFDTRGVVMTIAVREKGKTLDEGGFELTSSSWLAQRMEQMDEVGAFDPASSIAVTTARRRRRRIRTASA